MVVWRGVVLEGLIKREKASDENTNTLYNYNTHFVAFLETEDFLVRKNTTRTTAMRTTTTT